MRGFDNNTELYAGRRHLDIRRDRCCHCWADNGHSDRCIAGYGNNNLHSRHRLHEDNNSNGEREPEPCNRYTDHMRGTDNDTEQYYARRRMEQH